MVVPEVQPTCPGLGHRRCLRGAGRRVDQGVTGQYGIGATAGSSGGGRVGRRGDGRLGRCARRRGSRAAGRHQCQRRVPLPPGPGPGRPRPRGGRRLSPPDHLGTDGPASVAEVSAALAAHDYLADEGLATAVFLALTLRRPLLLEGEAGVGKTEVAKVLARWTGGELLRLQCYEGIDVGQAVYEWDYARQLLHLRAAEVGGHSAEAVEDEL